MLASVLFCNAPSRPAAFTYDCGRFRTQELNSQSLKHSFFPQLLLGYLPRQTGSWAADLAKKREEYARFCEARTKH